MIEKQYHPLLNLVLDKDHLSSAESHLYRRNYKPSDLTISPRVLSHWRKNNLFLSRAGQGEHLSISFSELSWLKLVEELRSFNYPIKSIQQLKECLCPIIPLDELAAVRPVKEVLYAAVGGSKKIVDHALHHEADSTGFLSVNFLAFYIQQCLNSGEQIELLISKDGRYIPYSETHHNEFQRFKVFKRFKSESFLSISINSLIRKVNERVDHLTI